MILVYPGLGFFPFSQVILNVSQTLSRNHFYPAVK